jgi:hypothetical protein
MESDTKPLLYPTVTPKGAFRTYAATRVSSTRAAPPSHISNWLLLIQVPRVFLPFYRRIHQRRESNRIHHTLRRSCLN